VAVNDTPEVEPVDPNPVDDPDEPGISEQERQARLDRRANRTEDQPNS
jgi:hypothetical protein